MVLQPKQTVQFNSEKHELEVQVSNTASQRCGKMRNAFFCNENTSDGGNGHRRRAELQRFSSDLKQARKCSSAFGRIRSCKTERLASWEQHRWAVMGKRLSSGNALLLQIFAVNDYILSLSCSKVVRCMFEWSESCVRRKVLICQGSCSPHLPTLLPD